MPMFNILAGCIWPGGVGAGLYGFFVVAIIAVFVAGLMVGRTPEYLGKKIEAREMKLAMLAVLIYPLSCSASPRPRCCCRPRSTASTTPGRTACRRSSTPTLRPNGNNGSAFAGLNGNTPWFNTTLGIAMLLGRFA